MADSRIIRVAGVKVGIIGLDQALEELADQCAGLSDEQVGDLMLERLGKRNYMPDSRRQDYARALCREMRRSLGQPVSRESGNGGLEIKVLGQGCARCEELSKRVMKVLGELDLDADFEHVTDLNEIVELAGMASSPALWINGKVKAMGRVLSEADIRRHLAACR